MTTTLATKQDSSSASLALIPQHLRQYAGNRDGKEGVSQEDLLIPRLAIAQAGMSPQLKKTNEAYMPDLEAGQLFNTVTGQIYGDAVAVLPLFFFKQYFHMKPISEGGGIIAQYAKKEDVPAELLAWVDGKPPICTEYKCRMCLIADESGNLQPIVLSFKSTGMKTAKQWNSLISMLNLPSYARFYKFAVVTKRKGEQEWFGINPSIGDFADESLFNRAQQYFHDLQDAGYKVDTSGLDEEAGDTEFQGQTIDADQQM